MPGFGDFDGCDLPPMGSANTKEDNMENLYLLAVREGSFMLFFLCDDLGLVDFWVEVI